MIANVQDALAVPKSARIIRAALSGNRVGSIFSEVRSDLSAHTLHRELKTTDHPTAVIWSLWIGRYSKPVPFLHGTQFQEERYGYVLLLELDGFVGVLCSGVGEVADSIAEGAVSYQALLGLRAGSGVEVESLSTRSLRAARVGVMRNTQTGRHLERTVARIGASQAAPFQVALRDNDQAWRISPTSGRVALSGKRSSIADLCSWFSATCHDLLTGAEPSDFMKAFAHPVALADLPAGVIPTALQLDSSIIPDLVDGGASLQRNGLDLTTDEIEFTAALLRKLWLVAPEQSPEDADSGTWRLQADGTEMGRLVFRETKISLISEQLKDVKIVDPYEATQSLNQFFNSGSQPLRLTFSDPSYAYAAGQLFRDHRLMGSREALLQVLTPALPPAAGVEKGHSGNLFSTESLFGFVVNHAGVSDTFLVCDDMGAEWADFIGVSPAQHQVSFYHCKGGSIDVGASGLHDVVSQAAKNLGYLTATAADLTSRENKWQGVWGSTSVPRLQRGPSVAEFTQAFMEAVAAPQATRRVVVVTSSLSRSAVAEAFTNLHLNHSHHEAAHVLWLLSGFVDQCRAMGAVPDIICRP